MAAKKKETGFLTSITTTKKSYSHGGGDGGGDGGGILMPILVVGGLGFAILGYMNRCEWFKICGNTQQPRSSSQQKRTKKKSSKKKHSSSNYTNYHTIDLANGTRYNTFGRIAI